MYSVTLAFGDEQKGWSGVYSYEIIGNELNMFKCEHDVKYGISVELPKQYRLIITKEESEEECQLS